MLYKLIRPNLMLLIKYVKLIKEYDEVLIKYTT